MRKKSGFGHFSRGADLWLHQLRLCLSALRMAFIFALLLSLVLGSFYFWLKSSVSERYALTQHVLAHTRQTLNMTAGPMELVVNDTLLLLPVEKVIGLTQPLAQQGLATLIKSAYMAGLSFLLGLFFFIAFWWHYGRGKIAEQQLRGSGLVEGDALRRLLTLRQDAAPYYLAGVPMRKQTETLHTLIGGAPGTGKSQQFFELMRQVRARGKRMIVYDPSGEFTQAFYREGVDVLMNPLDKRSPNWNVWNEVEKDFHFDNLAQGLIPEPTQSDPFWALAARMVFKEVVKVLGEQGLRRNQALYEAIAKSNLQDMYALLAGTAGASYVDPKADRTALSLKMTVQNQLEAFRFLHDEGKPFSIRQWVREEGDSWMFITAREAMREALKPVLSLWVDTAIKAVLDLEPVHQERLWFCLDELPTLQKLDILKLALTNARKYGLCMVLGVQDFSQLYHMYGRDLAKTIISSCQTKLVLRVADGDAAELLAKLLGQVEVDEKEETLSYGHNAQRDGVSFMSRRTKRDVILASEIMHLPDMTGYLVLPGDYPIAKVSFDYVPTSKIAEGFIERANQITLGLTDISHAENKTVEPARSEGHAL